MKKFRAAWNPSASAVDEAARQLPLLMRHFFRQGDKAVRPDSSEEQLHAFRLAAKRARYTLEVFEPLYGTAIKPCLAAIRSVQKVLGEVNDCRASLDLLREAAVPVEPAWIEAIEQRMAKKREEFVGLWSGEFSDRAMRRDWAARLAQPSSTYL